MPPINSHRAVTDPLWYKDAILYEVHVRAFYDSGDDGMGDFAGLTSQARLPAGFRRHRHLGAAIQSRHLGATTATTSADYTGVHPSYGTSASDFQTFLKEAHPRHARDHRTGTESHVRSASLVSALPARSPARSAWRNFYVWSDTPDKYREARIIFQDFESLPTGPGTRGQGLLLASLLLASAGSQLRQSGSSRASVKAMEFWLDMGVDGFRLDAVPYLYEREGTNCENLARDTRSS
jgi:maltose alpha-D-glucosyltransferase/alpha-amylase